MSGRRGTDRGTRNLFGSPFSFGRGSGGGRYRPPPGRRPRGRLPGNGPWCGPVPPPAPVRSQMVSSPANGATNSPSGDPQRRRTLCPRGPKGNLRCERGAALVGASCAGPDAFRLLVDGRGRLSAGASSTRMSCGPEETELLPSDGVIVSSEGMSFSSGLFRSDQLFSRISNGFWSSNRIFSCAFPWP